MLVLNISVREAELLKGELEGCRDMAQEMYDNAGDDETEKVIRKDEIKTLDHIIEEGLDDNWVRRGELVERCLSYFWEMYKDFDGFDDTMTELMDDMGIDEEELKDLFNELGYTEDEE